jgi:predicted CXXCH cytochrome family protein
MPSALRNPKTLPDWIQSDYLRRPRLLHRLRRRVVWMALAVSLACVGALWLSRNQTAFQRAPLSGSHALLANQCRECHTTPFQAVGRFLPGGAHVASVGDRDCLRCHETGVHNTLQVESALPSCSACHREHQGPANLLRPPDDFCTGCHRDLQRNDGRPTLLASVSGFPDGHPEFGLLRRQEKDPATLRFNHALHLRPEGVADGKKQPAKLDCASCHRPAADRRYMRPVSYAQHCSACHTEALVFDKKRFPDDPAPHGTPEVVRTALKERYLGHLRRHPEELPGKTDTAAELAWLNEQINTAEARLFDGERNCRYCHQVERSGKERVVIVPTNVPQRWLPHSEFRHDRHRALNCSHCHEAAATSSRTSDVLLPSIDTCKQCHRPAERAGTACFTCHSYHHSDRGEEAAGVRTREHPALPPLGSRVRRLLGAGDTATP